MLPKKTPQRTDLDIASFIRSSTEVGGDYYDFFELLDDKPILADGRPNLIYIMYSSLVYPAITLTGHFVPETITMTDSAESPDGIQWGANFRVTGSNPKFYSSAELQKSWWQQFSPMNFTALAK